MVVQRSTERRQPPERISRAHFTARLAKMADLLGYSRDDQLAVMGSRPLLAPRRDAIIRRVLESLAKQEELATYFVAPQGPMPQHCFASDRLGVGDWLRVAMEGCVDDEAAEFLVETARAHTRRGGRTAGRIRARYLVAAMQLLGQAISEELDAQAPRKQDSRVIAASWSKLLMLHVDLILAVYGSTEGNAHWY